MFLAIKNKKSGQATTEYILMLVVAVVLFQFIASPLLQNMTKWSAGMAGPGGYYGCLLENGLLPGFKYAGEKDVNCGTLEIVAIEELTNQGEGLLAPPDGESGLAGSSGTKGEGSESGRKRASNKRKSKARRSGRAPSSSSESSAYSGDSAGALGGKRYAGKRRVGLKNEAEDDKKASFKRAEGRSADDEYEKVKKRKGKRRYQSRGDYGYAKGYFGFEIPEEEEEKLPSFKQHTSTKKEALQRKKGSEIITRKIATKKSALEKDEPLEFGDFLKYLFIACLIIIIFVVLGSQILELSNKE